MVSKLLFLFFIISATCFSFGQEIEKLQQELKKNPKTRLQTAVKLKDLLADYSNDSIFNLGNYLLNQGITDDSESLIMYGKLVLSDYYNTEGKVDFSIKYLTECINYYKRKGDLENLAHAQNLMGIAYIYSSEYNKAATWLIKSIKTAEKIGPDNQSYMGQLNLAEVYIREEKLDLAEAEVLSYIEKTKKQNLLVGLKRGYDFLAKVYMHKGDMQLAIQYYKQALELALKNASKTGKANAYNNMAIAHFEMGEMELSLENFKKALQLRIELNDPLEICESYYNLGDWNFYQDHFDEAIHYYKISLDIAQKNNLVNETADACEMLAMSYKAKGNYKEAFDYMEKNMEQRDLMRKKNQVREIDLQRAAYEMQREEQRLNQKKREDRMRNRVETEQDRGKIIVIGFSLVVGLLIISYFFLLAQNQRSKEKMQVVENPDFKGDQFKVQESKWNKMEHFISRNESEGKELNTHFPENIKSIQNFDSFELEEGVFLFWEANVSKLENYLFRDYLRNHVKAGISAEALTAIFDNQKLVDTENLTYGTIASKNNEILVSGKDGLLIQNKDKMSFLTENQTSIKTFTVLISERFKNELVITAEWDRFMEQMEMIQKMSLKMGIQTIEECWSEILEAKKMGMILFFPGNN